MESDEEMTKINFSERISLINKKFSESVNKVVALSTSDATKICDFYKKSKSLNNDSYLELKSIWKNYELPISLNGLPLPKYFESGIDKEALDKIKCVMKESL